VTTTLADYLLPTAMEVPMMETLYKETPSPLNPLGVKGVGEIGVVGVAAAVGNAIWHATGKRVRDLPITLDKLFA
jgi:xanthine dehydrogenase YagR molybdenum-binding subunit